MANLRSTISTFSGSGFDPKAWKNQTMRADNDALLNSKAEDPLFKSDRLTNLNRTTVDQLSKATHDHHRDRKN